MTTRTRQSKAKEPSAPPAARVRAGLITGSLWARDTEAGRFYAATFERRYRAKDGEWRSTRSFGESDLLALAKAANLAYDAIRALKDTDAEAAAAEEADDPDDLGEEE